MTIWTFKFTKSCEKDFKKLDKSDAVKIITYLHKNVMNASDPKAFAKPLVGDLQGYYRFRIGNFRLVVDIKEDILTIIGIDVGHRSSIYE